MTSDVGINHLIPEHYRTIGYLREADLAYWEATYDDGTVVRETDGTRYDAIDRSRLSTFRIVHHGEIMLEVWPPAGATGHNLVYRRRTALGQSGAGRTVWFIVGFAPMGPMHALNLDELKMVSTDSFTSGGLFDVPVPQLGEPPVLLDKEQQ